MELVWRKPNRCFTNVAISIATPTIFESFVAWNCRLPFLNMFGLICCRLFKEMFHFIFLSNIRPLRRFLAIILWETYCFSQRKFSITNCDIKLHKHYAKFVVSFTFCFLHFIVIVPHICFAFLCGILVSVKNTNKQNNSFNFGIRAGY